MRWSRFSGLMVAVAFACGLASGADALPLAGKARVGEAHVDTPMVQLVAHKHQEWYWNGHWWRPGPWSDHVIVGIYPRRGHHVLFVPRDAERLDDCPATVGPFAPAPETYVTKDGKCCVCR